MRIVCGTDLSDESRAGLRLCLALADSLDLDAESLDLELLHVLPLELMRLDKGQLLTEDIDNQARIRDSIHDWAEETLGTLPFYVHVKEGKAYHRIQERLEEAPADFLVLSQTGMGTFAALSLGSTAHKIAHQPPTSTWIAHRDFQAFDLSARIVVAVDFRPASIAALKEALRLARSLQTGIDLVHVSAPLRAPVFPDGMSTYPMTAAELTAADDPEAKMRTFLRDHADLLDGVDIHSHVIQGPPVRQLVEYASNQGSIALCLGISEKSRLERFLLGSVASGVLRHMPCSILLTQPPE